MAPSMPNRRSLLSTFSGSDLSEESDPEHAQRAAAAKIDRRSMIRWCDTWEDVAVYRFTLNCCADDELYIGMWGSPTKLMGKAYMRCRQGECSSGVEIT